MTARRLLASIVLATSLLGCAARAPQPSTSAPVADVTPDRAARRAELRKQLAARRQLHIARLHDYAQAGQFPRQRLDPQNRINVFIDEEGHLCAVANLMALDGKRLMVDQISQVNNTLQLVDVRTGEVMKWMLESGLTQEEIAFIQEPYTYDPIPVDPKLRDMEVKRLQKHFEAAEARLVADFDKSLDLAVDRLMAEGA